MQQKYIYQYFLFLKHPEGINLKELSNYKKELLTLYKSVSNQLDYDKMAKSIVDVINLETKAIYTHLSRIKSAFYKIMDASHANHYIISGNGEENRKVLFESVKKTGDGAMEILEGYSDNYIRVTTPYRAEWSNQIVDWTI